QQDRLFGFERVQAVPWGDRGQFLELNHLPGSCVTPRVTAGLHHRLRHLAVENGKLRLVPHQ
ncbi:MAG: hypothetical protein ACK56I_25280, partial [bacterium]